MKTKKEVQPHHTPTPWKHWEACEGYLITDMNNRFVAKLTDSTGLIGDKDIPNAAYILKRKIIKYGLRLLK